MPNQEPVELGEMSTLQRVAVVLELHVETPNEPRFNQPITLLLQRHHKGNLGGSWEFPGGGIEIGSRGPETVLDETFQECGLTLNPDLLEYAPRRMIRGNVSIPDPRNRRTVVTTPFLYEAVVDDVPRITLSPEHEDYRWIRLPELGQIFPVVEGVPLRVSILNPSERIASFDVVSGSEIEELSLTSTSVALLNALQHLRSDIDSPFRAITPAFPHWTPIGTEIPRADDRDV